MKKISLFSKSIAIVFLSVFLQISCTTEDILPTIELSAQSETVSEANGTTEFTVSLNAVTTSKVTIPLQISGSATINSDYTLSAEEIVINAGQSTGSITITGVQDQEIEGIETLIIDAGQTNDFLVLSNSSFEIAILDDDADSDNDGVLDADDNCPNEAGDIANNGCPFLGFLINEVLYDPESGLAGDANNDGTRDANGDEFIEFFNSGPQLDLSGYTVSDADQVRHVFPSGTILGVNQVLVLFGSGNPTGTFGGAIVQTASTGSINMSNAGDFVTVRDPNGNIVLTFGVEPLSNNPNESYTRNPDLTGDFVQHAGVAEANGALFSPGTKLDGSSF